MTVVDSRLKALERYGRVYGALGFAVGWTVGLVGDDAKVSRHWQSRPDRLADPEHGAALLRGRGMNRNPVVSLKQSFLLGVDIDGPAGRALLGELVPDGLPRTVVVRSGRSDGGMHAWFRPPENCRHHKLEFGKKLVLSADGYFVAPPGVHASGAVYSFAPGRSPEEHPIAVFPADVYQRLLKHNRQSNGAAREDDSTPITEPGRYLHLRRLGCSMRYAGFGLVPIRAALLAENETRCQPQLDEEEVTTLADDIVTRWQAGGRAA